MSLDFEMVRAAVANGLSVICATCGRYWDGRRKGLPGSKCSVVKPCGSPIVRLTFPEYVGPITNFARMCFVCGGDSAYGLRVGASERVIGVCKQHVRMLKDVQPVNLKLNGDPVVDIVDAVRGRISQTSFFGPRKKLFSEVVSEVEAELSGKSGGE